MQVEARSSPEVGPGVTRVYVESGHPCFPGRYCPFIGCVVGAFAGGLIWAGSDIRRFFVSNHVVSIRAFDHENLQGDQPAASSMENAGRCCCGVW